MYNETNVPGPEYRVRPVVRYVVTRYCHAYSSQDGKSGQLGSSEVVGEFDNENMARMVAQATAKFEEKFGATFQE